MGDRVAPLLLVWLCFVKEFGKPLRQFQELLKVLLAMCLLGTKRRVQE
jgi:hypothetical protein